MKRHILIDILIDCSCACVQGCVCKCVCVWLLKKIYSNTITNDLLECCQEPDLRTIVLK